MSNSELQKEEREVLLSIYDGDERFKDISPTVYQYKYGQENDPKSFLLEISWTENYPTEKPKINMNAFYNRHMEENIKLKIINTILEEAEHYLGDAMTYTLFEFVKEKETELTDEITEKVICNDEASVQSQKKEIETTEKKEAVKKQQLTKAQKRRQWDKVGAKGEKPRGWNWVDLVKHLSQTSSKSANDNLSPNN